MLSAMEELFYGNIQPDRCGPSTPEPRQLMRRRAECFLSLSDALAEIRPSLKEQLDQLQEMQEELNGDKMLQLFRLGLSLGLHLGLESYAVLEETASI